MQFWNSLKQFRVIAGIYIKKQMTYRLNFITPYILRVFQLVGSIVVWKALFKSQDMINGYTFEEMISYLLFAQFILLIFYPFHMFSLQELVRKGTLSSYLLRPYPYMLNSWSEFFGVKSIHLLFFTLLFFFASVFGGVDQLIGLKQIGIISLSFTLSFFFGFLISTFAFHIIEMWPIKNLFMAGMAILGGTIVPLDLLPDYISSWAPYTPFAYFSYVNVKVLQGSLSNELLTIHLWNLIFQNQIFWILASFSFSKGLKRYEAVGC